ncbi:MAG: TIGR03032 family protein [Acidobacteria bacterium]|nr:TIGR03032 family protein [Acidobacteriota bacterium]
MGDAEWRPHPQGHKGNWSLPLVSVGGDPANDETKGAMLPTPFLERCPYVRQVMASFAAPVGRSRLMLIEGAGEAISHVDTNYYWAQRVRVHVPIRTNPHVEFLCGDRSVHMEAGEAWIFDNWRSHNVLNPHADQRVHLVIDTVGSSRFWTDVARGYWPFGGRGAAESEPELIAFDGRLDRALELESVNHPVVMSPWEMQSLAAIVFDGLQTTDVPAARERLRVEVDSFLGEWRAAWSVEGERKSGWPRYRALLDRLDVVLGEVAGQLRLSNNCKADEIVRQLLIRPALSPELATAAPSPKGAKVPSAGVATGEGRKAFERPVFIVSPPRSGSSLLFETLAQSPSLWTIGGESHALIESIDELHPAQRDWESNRLLSDAATHAVIRRLTNAYRAGIVDRDGNPPETSATGLRLLEKTPKNALRIPFLAKAFPDAMFIYLYRDPRETVSSMLDAWRSGRFVMYPSLPDWKGAPWSLLLIPGWRALIGKPLVQIVAAQWRTTVATLLDDLEELPPDRWCVTSYDKLVAEPQGEIERLAAFVGVEWDRALRSPLPESRHTLTSPDPNKWKRNATELAEIMPVVSDVAERARQLFGRVPARTPSGWQASEAVAAASDSVGESPRQHPLRSVSTPSMTDLLVQGEFSFLISTYQSGKLIAVRAKDGRLDTHFSSFPSPMGIAIGERYLALGTETSIWHYRNQREVGTKISPIADSCFLPVRAHSTGDIRVHEMAWAGDELWLVNTRFSSLCTLDDHHSFVPRWRPRFISSLAAEDRCHLNGLCVIEDRVRYVTALGETDAAGGWRENKGAGGVLIDVDSGEIVARGLSMPHSPRWYRGSLWVLESGKGELGRVDLATGRVESVAQLPGFTRGLAFAGPYALIGLSQVRESVFDGLPLTARLKERACGVWVVDIRDGRTVGLLKFEDQVQEIFDVQILPGLRFPELVEPSSPWVKGSFVLPDEAVREAVISPN